MSAEGLGILLWQLWLYMRLTCLSRLLLQIAVVLLRSSLTGTRSRIIVPPKSILTTSKKLPVEDKIMDRQHHLKTAGEKLRDFQSNIPKYVWYDDSPPTLCYRDINLFVIRNPEGGSNIITAIVNF